MQNDLFAENLNSLFSLRAPELRFHDDEVHYGTIIDDNENAIHTFPILEYEERYLSQDDSESYTHISICTYGQLKEVARTKSSELFDSRFFTSRYGNKPFASFTKHSWKIFFKTIKVMLPEIEQKVIYRYSGWSKDLDKYLFGKLLVDANSALTIESTLVKADTLLSDKTESDVCKTVNDIFANLTSSKLIGYTLLMYLFLSHIKQRFITAHRLGPEFVLAIIGGTGSYKTSTSMATFNTYDTTVSSFEDSLASIRRIFQANKSGVTIVDDYKTSSKSLDAKLEKIVRLSGDVQTTGKYVVGNKVFDELVTGMSVITGERRPQLQQSSYSRILFADLENSPINLEVLTELQSSKAEINSFIVLFIQFILQNPRFDDEFIALFQQHRDQLMTDPNYKGMHGRYYSMYGWLAAMWEAYVHFLQKYCTSPEIDFKSELKAYIHLQNCRYDNNPVKLFKLGYAELLNSNELVVTSSDSNIIDSLSFDVIDLGDKLFFKSGGAYKKICQHWLDKGIDFTCSERKLRSLLHESGILVPGERGNLTTEKKTRNNRSYSGYYLLKNLFLTYGGNEHE